MRASTIKRIEALESVAGGDDQVDEIHVRFVEGTPEGPRYTGQVIVMPCGGGERYEEIWPDLIGQPATGKGGLAPNAKLTVHINKPQPASGGVAREA